MQKVGVFCKIGQDSIKHYIEECEEMKKWFKDLGVDNKEKYKTIWNNELDEIKRRIIKRLWKEKEIRKKENKERENIDCNIQ